jgi:macrolide transport system ATP-binding/permease protein
MPEWKEEIRQRLASLKLEPSREVEIVEELSQHLADRYAESLTRGATPDEAYLAALAELSESDSLARELLRVERQTAQEPIVTGANRRGNMLVDLWQDIRYGLRTLGKRPGFTAVVVFTLALGIGVNTTIFTFFNIFLRPLPVKDPDTIVRLEYRAANPWGEGRYSFPDYVHFRDNAKSYAGLLAMDATGFLLDNESQEPQRVYAAFVSDNYFSELGAGLSLGRFFAPEENRAPSQYPVAILSYYFWQSHFAGDPQVLGRTLRFHGQTFTVIGVTARDFVGHDYRRNVPNVWLPLLMSDVMMTEWTTAYKKGDRIEARDNRWLNVYGRLKPGVTLEQARAEADLLMSQLLGAYPEINAKDRANVLSATPRLDRDDWRFWGTALGATLVVLLIACSNVANLLLGRAAWRKKEISMRLCLGASRGRLIRQLLTESLLLAGLGGVAGLLLAWWSAGALATELLSTLGEVDSKVLDFTPDRRILGFTLLVSLLSGMMFGLAPALRATRADLVAIIKDEGAAFSQRISRSWLRSGLVVTQVSLCMVLLAAAGLLLRGLIRATTLDRGFETKKALAMELGYDPRGSDNARQQQIQQELAARLETLPGVQSVSRTTGLGIYRVTIPGEGEDASSRTTSASCYPVTPNYFETLSIPILRGRAFTEEEMRAGAEVIVVSESTARNLWPDQEPLGKIVKQSGAAFQVIGVARDAQNDRIGEIPPILYYRPLRPNDRDVGRDDPNLLVRTERDLNEMNAAVRAAARAFDPSLKLKADSLENFLDGMSEVRNARAASELTVLFGLLALLLASTGLYGVMAYTVSQRTREIGIRVALGAQAADVMKLVLRQGMKLVLLGVVLGTGASLAVTRLVKSLLFGLSTIDPLAYAGVASLLAIVALLACWLPARRATKVDPLVALRHE